MNLPPIHQIIRLRIEPGPNMINSLLLLVVLYCAACGKKPKDFPLESNSILPLKENNFWSYSDTIILARSGFPADTIISAVTYRVTEQVTYDGYYLGDKGDYDPATYQGWAIEPDSSNLKKYYVFPLDGNIFCGGPFRDSISLIVGDCYGLKWKYDYSTKMGDDFLNTGLRYRPKKYPKHIQENSVWEGRGTAMQFPYMPGDTIYGFPLFQELPCGLIPGDGYNPGNVYLKLSPKTASPSLTIVTTPAGTFSCIDFGVEFWAENVGLVRCVYSGNGSYFDIHGTIHTYEVSWSRTLNAYLTN